MGRVSSSSRRRTRLGYLKCPGAREAVARPTALQDPVVHSPRTLAFSPRGRERTPKGFVTREFDVGLELFARKEYARAAKAFEEVLFGDPHHARAWSYLGISLAHMGRAGDAEQALQRAIRIAPSNGECWFHLGVAQGLEADWARAAERFGTRPRSCRRTWPPGSAGGGVGGSWRHRRQRRRVRTCVDPLPRHGAVERSIHHLRGSSDDHLLQPGRRERPEEAESWISLALSLLTLGDVEEAVAAYERGYSVDPGPSPPLDVPSDAQAPLRHFRRSQREPARGAGLRRRPGVSHSTPPAASHAGPEHPARGHRLGQGSGTSPRTTGPGRVRAFAALEDQRLRGAPHRFFRLACSPRKS